MVAVINAVNVFRNEKGEIVRKPYMYVGFGFTKQEAAKDVKRKVHLFLTTPNSIEIQTKKRRPH